MNFRYRKFPVDSKNCPFQDKKSALRPVIQIDFETKSGNFGYLVLIDSGADYCIFHASIGKQLGLDIKSGKSLTFFGTSGEPQKAYFHKITFKIGGWLHACEVGFSYDMEKLAYGLLGQDGFFNKWAVKFEYQKENIELKEIASRVKMKLLRSKLRSFFFCSLREDYSFHPRSKLRGFLAHKIKSATCSKYFTPLSFCQLFPSPIMSRFCYA